MDTSSCLGAMILLITMWVGTSAVSQITTPLRCVLVLYSNERLLPVSIIGDEAIRVTAPLFAESSTGI